MQGHRKLTFQNRILKTVQKVALKYTGRGITEGINSLSLQNIKERSVYDIVWSKLILHSKFFLKAMVCLEYDFLLPDVTCIGKVIPSYNCGL